MSQQQIHNLAEDNARFTSWGFRESKNGKNFEFLGLVGCIFVVLRVCFSVRASVHNVDKA